MTDNQNSQGSSPYGYGESTDRPDLTKGPTYEPSSPYGQSPSPYGQPSQPGGFSPYGQQEQPAQASSYDIYATQRDPAAQPDHGQSYPPAPYQGYPVQPGQAVQPTNSLAVAALVCGVAGLMVPFASIAAIICGHLSLRAIKQTGEQGRGMALAGTILGWFVTILCVLAIVFFIVVLIAAPDAARDSTWDGSS